MGTYRSFVFEENKILLDNSNNNQSDDNSLLLIKMKYSAINYSDVIALSKNKDIVKTFPYTYNMDFVGSVVESSSPSFCCGDEVIITGCGSDCVLSGAYIQIPASRAILLPTGLSMKECITIGSDGLIATIALMDILFAGVYNQHKTAIISGANFGIGCFALSLLAMNGFRITAIISDISCADFVKSLGAIEAITVEDFLGSPNAPLLSEKYALGVDTIGGNVFSTLITSMQKYGSVALCSTLTSEAIPIYLQPIISRSLNILGLNFADCSYNLKKSAWDKLSGDWFLKALPMLCNEISSLEINDYISLLLKGNINGRLVINHTI